jgi:class 3 adenylate cyclase
MEYRPDPIETSGIELDPHLLDLTERLAEHAHDLWARLRLAQGWEYGPTRDDAAKRHPCLVPYQDLPESEKEHDRATALGTLRAVLKLGFQLVPPPDVALPAIAADHSRVAELIEQLQPGLLGLDGLQAVWNGHSPQHWATFPELYSLLGKRLLERGSPLLAYDVLAEGRTFRPRDVRLRQLAASALARSGASAAANSLMHRLYEEGHRDEETLGILARTHKDLALQARMPEERTRQLRQSLQYYAEGFVLTGGSYTGINAATMGLLLGRSDETRELARRSRKAAQSELAGTTSDAYWGTATLAEAALLLGEESEALRLYAEAARIAGGRYGDLASTRRNARLILAAQGRPLDLVESAMPIPRVVVFAGHMIDRPGRPTPRFPAGAEPAVAGALDRKLAEINAGYGFAGAAAGGDILFHEAMARRGGKSSVVLPYPESDFLPDSVAIDGGDEWVNRFEGVLGRSGSVLRAVGQRFTESTVFFDYANLLLLGLARIQSEQLGVELVPLALWDGQPGDGPGGTAATVADWRSRGLRIEVIGLPTPNAAPAVPARPLSPQVENPPLETRIMAVLFADVVNFSKLTEVEIPRFVEHFLGRVGRLVRDSPHPPLVSNTWGDGLYFVFDGVADAGEWALELCEMASVTDWSVHGLRKDLSLRVALHAGPLFTCTDPVTNQRNFTGKQVVPAARLEPVTPPGQVYASQEFAALTAAGQVTTFVCQPVGRLGLAKGAGTVPVYHLSRAATQIPAAAGPHR